MKYILYRSFGDLDKDIKKHELVAVEIGGSIDEVTNALIKDVAEDLAEMPEYAHCEIAAYAPELIHNFRRVKRYQYEMQGMVSTTGLWKPRSEKQPSALVSDTEGSLFAQTAYRFWNQRVSRFATPLLTGYAFSESAVWLSSHLLTL